MSTFETLAIVVVVYAVAFAAHRVSRAAEPRANAEESTAKSPGVRQTSVA
jgi:hypothetical protein